ncbi:Hpt sensor hybrid histidine kinase [Desulfovibrio sp. DV]|uniref:response regulator n=1 Tax=Desulfovibrio sp. DV TaxID=1844708 RepID=UPI0009604D6C|nr:response regulator [Desulfovibrio sp. DV]OLN29017.1 Hpt sensor hybrid histidine kinase [Desulfovibrio sp. DV]
MKDPAADVMTADLRRKAESLIAQSPASELGQLSVADMARLIHELRVNQIELELQNDELRRTQAELAETRDRYANLYDFAPAGYFTLDPRGVILEANLKGSAMLGIARSELVGKPFVVRVARSDQSAFHTSLSRTLEANCPQTLEVRLTRRDGSRFTAELTTEPWTGSNPDQPGRTLRMMVADVSVRCEADDAMRQASLILEASPAYLIRYPVADGEPGPVSYVSSNIARFGFSRDALLSGARSPKSLIHPEDRQRVEAAMRDYAASGRDAFALDYRIVTQNGQIRHVTDRIQFSRDASGQVSAVQGLVLDVTESVQSRRDLELVLNSAPIPIVKVRLTDSGDRILEYQNPAAERLFGPSARGLSCKDYLCNKDICPVLNAASGVVRERECAIKTLNGDRIMYKTASRLPGTSSIIEAMVDVTELMRTRERLTRAMEAAEAANRTKSQFLATMSHEIRTPMNGIMGMVELAMSTELTPEQRDYLDLARQSAVNLLEIINDILDFSRIEAGRMELGHTPFALRDTMGVCQRLYSGLAARHGNSLTMTVAPDVPETLIGDPGRLAQIVANLVSNGLKFTKNGTVRVLVQPAPAIHCAVPEPGTPSMTLLFSVADDGMGIPRDKHGRIFEYFTQLDASLNRGAGGTGLGLSISSNLVKLMGGRIWVESEPDLGSTFFFTAVFEMPPAQPEPAQTAPARAKHPQALSPLSILLVEDNLINQLVAKRLLERRGHAVTAVDSGQAALDLLATTPFHCVLMDVEMPGLSGLETLRRLRDVETFGDTAATPVVALTAHAIKGYRERMLEAGFDDYVPKPIDMNELDAALERIAAR